MPNRRPSPKMQRKDTDLTTTKLGPFVNWAVWGLFERVFAMDSRLLRNKKPTKIKKHHCGNWLALQLCLSPRVPLHCLITEQMGIDHEKWSCVRYNIFSQDSIDYFRHVWCRLDRYWCQNGFILKWPKIGWPKFGSPPYGCRLNNFPQFLEILRLQLTQCFKFQK